MRAVTTLSLTTVLKNYWTAIRSSPVGKFSRMTLTSVIISEGRRRTKKGKYCLCGQSPCTVKILKRLFSVCREYEAVFFSIFFRAKYDKLNIRALLAVYSSSSRLRLIIPIIQLSNDSPLGLELHDMLIRTDYLKKTHESN